MQKQEIGVHLVDIVDELILTMKGHFANFDVVADPVAQVDQHCNVEEGDRQHQGYLHYWRYLLRVRISVVVFVSVDYVKENFGH